MRKLLLFIALVVITPITMKADEGLINGINYWFGGGEAWVEALPDGEKYSGDIVIPEKIFVDDVEYTVTNIDSYAFAHCPDITSVVFPNSMQEIQEGAFSGCSGLQSIEFPSSVTFVGEWGFAYCSNLKSVVFHASSILLDADAFEDCSKLTSVTFRGNSVYCYGRPFKSVGTPANPCFLNVPDDFNYSEEEVDTSADYFMWFGGYFTLNDNSTVDPDLKTDIVIGSNGVATYCSDYDLDFSEVTDFVACIATGYNKKTGNIIVQSVNDAPAGTGLYLKGKPGTYEVPCVVSGSYFINMLVGTNDNTVISPIDGEYVNLILYDGSYGVNFYTLGGDHEMGAHKAYLQIPSSVIGSSAGANYVGIEFEDGMTGISETPKGTTDTKWFTLDGRRLNGKPAVKGVYVTGGRKVVIK